MFKKIVLIVLMVMVIFCNISHTQEIDNAKFLVGIESILVMVGMDKKLGLDRELIESTIELPLRKVDICIVDSDNKCDNNVDLLWVNIDVLNKDIENSDLIIYQILVKLQQKGSVTKKVKTKNITTVGYITTWNSGKWGYVSNVDDFKEIVTKVIEDIMVVFVNDYLGVNKITK